MTERGEHVEFARLNEGFASDLYDDPNYQDRKNWMVTVRFYSLLHYVEQRLVMEGYDSKSHHDRKENIRECASVENVIYNRYRELEDLSRDARYECHWMTDEDVQRAGRVLERAKDELGFGSGSGSAKYEI